MKRKYKNNEEAVSPVIATILMVAITVVLAAVLYVMVIGMGDTGTITTPLGLNSAGKTTTTFTILVSNAPDGAMVAGTLFSFTHNNAVGAIANVTLYDASGIVAARYNIPAATPPVWTFVAPNTVDNLEYNAGMKLTITGVGAASVSAGDTLTISSAEADFGTTQYVV